MGNRQGDSNASRTKMIARPETEVTPVDQVFDMADEMYEVPAPPVRSSQLPVPPPHPDGKKVVKNTYIHHYVDGDGSMRVNQSNASPFSQSRPMTAESTERCYSNIGSYDKVIVQRIVTSSLDSSKSFHSADASTDRPSSQGNQLVNATPYQTPRSKSPGITGTSITTVQVHRGFDSPFDPLKARAKDMQLIMNEFRRQPYPRGRGPPTSTQRISPQNQTHLGPYGKPCPTVSVSDTQTGNTYYLEEYNPDYIPSNERISDTGSFDADEFRTARQNMSNEGLKKTPPTRQAQISLSKSSQGRSPKTKHLKEKEDGATRKWPPSVPRLDAIG